MFTGSDVLQFFQPALSKRMERELGGQPIPLEVREVVPGTKTKGPWK